MKGTSLTRGQIIAIGSTIVFGLPIGVGLVAGHFLGLWLGVASAGLVLLFIGYLARRWVKRVNKKEGH